MKTSRTIVGALLLLASTSMAMAQTANVVKDNFTGAYANLSWSAFNGACLTAGNNSGTIPSCKSNPYYSTSVYYYGQTPQNTPQVQTGLVNNQDQPGYGALRLTNGCANGNCYYQQNGAIISNTTFPTNQGIQVTFTTYTYGGDNSGGHGADGIGFYLINGTQTPNVGAWGGSLGYSCSNTNYPYNGMSGAYMGLGIDEYGNFLNQGDNTGTGYGYQPGRIGLRGFGNVNLASLQAINSNAGPSDVQNTCANGGSYKGVRIPDYAVIPNAYKILPSAQPIANESATVRTAATPITYKLQITQTGLLSFWYSYNGGIYQPVLANQNITSSNGPLPSSFRFGFGGSTGGSDNVHEITCFQATPANLSSSAAGINVQQSGEVRTGTQVYLAYYHPDNWWGQLTSQNLLVDPTTGAVSIAATANWDASCVLTGGACPATNVANVTAQAPSTRALITWSGALGIPFAWSSLTSQEQGWLNAGDNNGQSRLAYLTGARNNEINTSGSGLYRARTGVLGDIIDSSPTWVGAPSAPYPAIWQDLLNPTSTLAENATTAQTYPQFQTAEANRLNVVYDGANDGFMHAFETGAYTAAGAYDATLNDGKEILGYMPQAVLQSIHNATNAALDFSSVNYAHSFYTDATPGTGDLFYNGSWHTWLVSGLGPGGSALFALDITNPSTFSTATAANTVIGEWNASTLPCATACKSNLGQTYGTPQIRRLHNGDWGIIFGNGLNSATGLAGIYVMVINPATGQPLTTYFLSTGVGTLSKPDGIAYVTPVDLDGDHITDYVYAGDLLGNVWRFNLTSSNPASWAVSTYGQGGPTPLFVAKSGSTPQPITTQLMVVASNPGSVLPRVLVNFGTGQLIPQTTTAAAKYASGTQTLYGIWDWDFGTWNSSSSQQYASLSGTQSITSGTLQQQTVTGQFSATQPGSVQGYRTVSNAPVCFVGQTCSGSAGTQYGWYMNLPGSNGTGATEQLVFNPIEAYGAFVANTTVPANNSPFTCTVQNAQGWTMAIDPITGGSLPSSFFVGVGSLGNGGVISGVALNGTGSPSIVSANQVPYLITQTVTGTGAVTQVSPLGNHGGRLTWIELR